MKHFSKLLKVIFGAVILISCNNSDEEFNTNTEQPKTTEDPTCTLIEGRTWIVGHFNDYSGSADVGSYDVATVNGDSLINNTSYKKILNSHHSTDLKESQNNDSELLSLMREENGVVYFIEPGQTKEQVFFNSNKKIGEEGEPGTIISNITQEITGKDNIARKIFYFVANDNSGEEMGAYINGIGFSQRGLLNRPTYTGSKTILICCHEKDGTMIYGDDKHNCPLILYAKRMKQMED